MTFVNLHHNLSSLPMSIRRNGFEFGGTRAGPMSSFALAFLYHPQGCLGESLPSLLPLTPARVLWQPQQTSRGYWERDFHKKANSARAPSVKDEV